MDPLLRSALELQLRRRPAGARRVGWKLGMGERERIGDGPVIGHLTSATQLAPGAVFDAAGVRSLHADAEVAILVDAGGIAGYGAALELVDLGSPPDNPHDVVAANVFHRAFALGPVDRPAPPPGASGRLIVSGELRDEAPMERDFGRLVDTVRQLLVELGEELEPGDRLITGSVVQVPVARGERVVAELDSLGRVELVIEA